MKYAKQVSMSGAWVKAADLKSGTKARIASETINQPSTFTDPKTGAIKSQDVCKLRIQGVDEPMNCALNRATINALVDAYGDESSAWQGHTLTIETEKVRVAGVARVALYLVPDGYEKTDDQNGYAVISKKGIDFNNLEAPTPTEEADITVEDIPFN